MRQAHALWLLAGGADLKTVMDRLGHSQIATTQRYLHALAGADETALEAFTRIRDKRSGPASGTAQRQRPGFPSDGMDPPSV